MKWIGLTGGLGSGKSTVSNALRQKGFPVIDADEIARAVVKKGSPGLQSVVKALGADLLNESEELDRSKLAQLVFFDTEKKKLLENILHPLIRSEVLTQRKLLEKRSEKIAFYDIPLLFETGSEDLFDAILLVSCTEQAQIKRLKVRNKWSDEEIRARLNSQMPLIEKEELSDFVIRNEGTLSQLNAEIEKAVRWLKAL